MTKLRRLVKRYTSGEIQFSEFRRAFVMEFLAVADPDPTNWTAVLQMESECDDFAQGLITEDQLMLNLPAKLGSPNGMVSYPVSQPLIVSNVAFALLPIITSSFNVPVPVGGTVAGQLAGVTLSWAHA
jgi:hypothetical protein